MEDFGDLLEDIRNDGGELMWITKKKTFLENQSNKKRSPETIKLEVLKSQTIRHAIDQLLATSPELRREDILKEAQEIIDEMAHQFDLKYVRLLGYTLMKVFCKIYKHIYYNKDMTSNLEVLKHAPCLMLPLHRSYMDFLLVSIICFHKNVQMPAIATGMDFMGKQNKKKLKKKAVLV
jgi:glycerol-3-phosphate O-acyltransferase